VRYVLVEGCTGVVSLALVIVGMVLLSLSVLIVGWVLIPSYLRVLRWWADLARTRSARYSGSAVPHRYPPMPANPGIGDLRRLLTDRSTRRDGGWLVLHAMGAPVAFSPSRCHWARSIPLWFRSIGRRCPLMSRCPTLTP
jgi:hypothetical protein